jgi:hypothetical protein
LIESPVIIGNVIFFSWTIYGFEKSLKILKANHEHGKMMSLKRIYSVYFVLVALSALLFIFELED